VRHERRQFDPPHASTPTTDPAGEREEATAIFAT
jgi:hypothetical protein